MSRYLIDQIERTPRIITPRTQVAAFLGEGQLEGVELLGASGQRTSTRVAGLVRLHRRGTQHRVAGRPARPGQPRVPAYRQQRPDAELEDPNRLPMFLETSRPGVFAIGDVRSGSVKRAAAAIGEGSMAVRLVLERLQATGTAVTDPPRADT